jgi:hypothetical protein
MAGSGAGLEELVRAYFARQGFFALRGVSVRFEDEEVTDIDAWLYGRQSASLRTRTIVDAKDKRSPKAFERILWARGMQLALGCDRAIVATTDGGPKIIKFAHQQKVGLLTKDFLGRLQNKLGSADRMTLEQFIGNIRSYKDQKQDGDWVRKISDAKSAIVSLQGFPAFNKAMNVFAFFAERVHTRPHNKEQALRGAYFSAALACIALDIALERVVYEDQTSRYQSIASGVTYGDSGDGRVQKSITTVLEVIATALPNGRVVSKEAGEALTKTFENIRADVIAEYFAKEQNAHVLFSVAKELDDRAHSLDAADIQKIGLEAKAVLGVFADFVQIKRTGLLGVGPAEANGSETPEPKVDPEQRSDEPAGSGQGKLL